MQYISDRFRYDSSIDETDYSIMFDEFTKHIEDMEDVEIVSQGTIFAINMIANDAIGVDELLDLDDHILDEAGRLIDELSEFIYKSPVDSRSINESCIPKELRKFFSIEKNIELKKSLSQCKGMTRKEKMNMRSSKLKKKRRLF